MTIEPVDPTTEDKAVTPQASVILATMTAFWDWFDKRDVEKHIVAMATLLVSYQVLKWAMHFADVNEARNGTDIGLIIGSITATVAAFQTAVIKWYFDACTGGGA
jgi:hypothetical protein